MALSAVRRTVWTGLVFFAANLSLDPLLRPAAAQSEASETETGPPTSRQELLSRLRMEKQAHLTPAVPNRVERYFIEFDRAETPTIQDANFYGFYPRVAWPSRGSGMALGTRYWQADIAGPLDLAGAAFYSWKGYQHYDVQLGLMPHRSRGLPGRSWRGDDVYELGDRSRQGLPRLSLYGTFRYRYLPEEDYFGSGPGSRFEDRTNFLLEDTSAYLRAGIQLGDHLALGLRGGVTSYDLAEGKSSRYPSTEELFDEETAPGLDEPPDYLQLGASLLIESRDEPDNPHRGLMLALQALRFDDRSPSDSFSFWRYAADARGFVPFGSRQRMLALRALLVYDEADPGGRVPFFVQESLGGSHTLRGFDSFRFRGEKVMLYQAEYRWEGSPFWELAIFTDAGSVSPADSTLSFDRMEWDYGVGMRFKNFRSVLVRMEVAWSRETTRYYLRASSSF